MDKAAAPAVDLVELLGSSDDPRALDGRRHRLGGILVIAFCRSLREVVAEDLLPGQLASIRKFASHAFTGVLILKKVLLLIRWAPAALCVNEAPFFKSRMRDGRRFDGSLHLPRTWSAFSDGVLESAANFLIRHLKMVIASTRTIRKVEPCRVVNDDHAATCPTWIEISGAPSAPASE